MNELTIFFVVLFFILALVTVIGHGIWVFLANVFSGQHESSRPPTLRTAIQNANRHACPRCGSPRGPGLQVCAICNWPHPSTLALDGVGALRALRRQLEAFGQQGVLDADARAQLSSAIDAQEQRLLLAAQQATLPRPAVIEQPASLETPPVVAPPRSPMESQPEVSPPLAVPSPLTASQRAQKYATCRSVAISEGLAEPVTAAEPPKLREALSRIFAAFMDEKNIRWGELVGGLLIVGCLIALVFSFWSQIATVQALCASPR